MAPSNELHSGDRRVQPRDRRHRFRDRRLDATRLVPSGRVGRVVRWATGPWTSANGLSWFRLLVIILIVKWGVMELYMIPSSSMEPTLETDVRYWYRDRVAVNKLAFGPRIPFTKKRMVELGRPKRWDIVVFDAVAPGSVKEFVIKRVVGLPGERIEIRQNGLHIDGKPVEVPEHVGGIFRYGTKGVQANSDMFDLILNFAHRGQVARGIAGRDDERLKTLYEDLEALHPFLREIRPESLSALEKIEVLRGVRQDSFDVVREWWRNLRISGGHPRYGVVLRPKYTIVPPGHYYCLGDNLPESNDSRYFGWVPFENIVGRAFAVAHPPSRVGPLEGFSTTPVGKALLYGIPGAIVLWELIPGFIVFSWRMRGPVTHLGLKIDDHVIVDRIAYGLRIPFSTRRVWWWRDPKPGEVVCYSLSRTGGRRMELYFGETSEESASVSGRFIVRGPEDHPESWLEVDRLSILGRARSIWLPRTRRSRVRVT